MKLLLVGLMLAAVAFGGPPLICERISIGTAKSLPWQAEVNGWAGTLPGYDRKNLTEDTLALLVPGTPLPVRMETMRRAAIYAAQDPRKAEEIALRLTARVLDGGGADSLAWFDAGYFVETVRQAALIYKFDMLSAKEKENWKVRSGIAGLDGKKWVERAMAMGGKGMNSALARMGD